MIERALRFLNNLAGMSEGEVSRFFLGAGSTREAYILDQDFIIKIPRFVVRFHTTEHYTEQQMLNIIRRGVHQTETEIRVYNNCDTRHRYLVNPIVAHGKFLNMPFVVMPKLKIASRVVDFSVENIMEFISVLDLCVPLSFSDDLYSFSTGNYLYMDDLISNLDNFGIDGSNHVLITDYGTGC